MEETNNTIDNKNHFVIHQKTRKIENITKDATLAQGDHLSERFTFEMPRYIKGHDMTLCNKVRIHFINIDSKNIHKRSKDVYTVDDMALSTESEKTAVFTWLISGAATKYAGSLNFRITFTCLGTDADIEYKWSTEIYKDIPVTEGMENGEAATEEYSDVLEAWKKELESENAVIAFEQTRASTTDGGTNIWTATFRDGRKSDFEVKNGAKGEKGDTGDPAPTPAFARSTAEMTDTGKLYVMPDGYIYSHRLHENYNLIKRESIKAPKRLGEKSEGGGILDVSYGNTTNFVLDWFPAEENAYYCLSVKTGTDENGEDTRGCTINSNTAAEPTRMHLQLLNGENVVSTVYFDRTATGNNTLMSDYVQKVGARVTFRVPDLSEVLLNVPEHTSIEARVQFATAAGLDFSAAENITSNIIAGEENGYKAMLTSGSTAENAFNKSTKSEYINGDAEGYAIWESTGLLYNLPDAYEERIIELETDVPEMQGEITEIKAKLANPASSSPYYRDVNFGIVPDEYYRGVNSDYNSKGFGRNTTYAEVIAAYDALIDGNSYVTKSDLGQSSDGQTLCLYRFTPAQVSNRKKPLPKIAIIAGQHGQEKGSVFGLYYFIENLLNNWQKSAVLAYLRNNVEFLIIPVVNTYGFDNWSYTNANGVNLNRNYGVNWSADGTGEQYGGEEPFDQPETQIVGALINSNRDTLLFVDFHTCNAGVAPLTLLHYYGAYSYNADAYFNRLYDVIDCNLRSIALNFNEDYTFNAPNQIYGQMASWDGNGLARTWVSAQNVLGSLVEGFNGFTVDGEEKLLEGAVYKANEEVLVNWLASAMYYLRA